tara:strand:- start:1758 stop:2012 length:255 start_codon:yes stop_codon:yes gene_type:complete
MKDVPVTSVLQDAISKSIHDDIDRGCLVCGRSDSDNVVTDERIAHLEGELAKSREYSIAMSEDNTKLQDEVAKLLEVQEGVGND